jgi:hypothetical protein
MTETTKKATTPKKPRATAPKTATSKNGASKKKGAKADVTPIMVSHDEIAMLAHRFWAERGHEHGHDAEDWFRAEQALLGKAS